MKEIEQYQRRIMAALEKISAMAGAMDAGTTAPDPSEIEELKGALQNAQAELATEKTNAAALAEQLQEQKGSAETDDLPFDGRVERLREKVQNQELKIQRLKNANTHLRETNGRLREEALANIGDATTIDASMQAELEALRATRAAEVGEMDAILEELKPLVEGRINA